jgi:hypothetical protein
MNQLRQKIQALRQIHREDKRRTIRTKIDELEALHTQYRTIMGKDDQRIAIKIDDQEDQLTLLEKPSENFEKMLSAYTTMMAKTDEENRIFLLPPTTQYLQENPDELDCSVIQKSAEKIASRTLTEGEYGAMLKPYFLLPVVSDAHQVSQIVQRDGLFLPVMQTVNIKTIRDLESAPDDEQKALLEQVYVGMTELLPLVGERYNWHALTVQEFTSLKEGLDKYTASSSNDRIEAMINFVNANIPSDLWDSLRPSEQNAIKYSRTRDRRSAMGEYQKMTRPREENLVSIIMKIFPRMTMANDPYRHDTSEKLSVALRDKSVDASAVFFIENFLTYEIRAVRDPMYNRAVYANMKNFVDYLDECSRILEKDEFDFINIEREYGVLKSMTRQYEAKKHLTVNQRRYAFNCMISIITKFQFSPGTVKAKISQHYSTMLEKSEQRIPHEAQPILPSTD